MNPETLADIVKWLRNTKAKNAVRRTYALTLADRIEAAMAREAEEWNALRVKVADFENMKARLARAEARMEEAAR